MGALPPAGPALPLPRQARWCRAGTRLGAEDAPGRQPDTSLSTMHRRCPLVQKLGRARSPRQHRPLAAGSDVKTRQEPIWPAVRVREQVTRRRVSPPGGALGCLAPVVAPCLATGPGQRFMPPVTDGAEAAAACALSAAFAALYCGGSGVQPGRAAADRN